MHAQGDLRPLAVEQGALRRVATLVADQAAPDAIFASVAEEIASILRADRCAIGRFEADDSMTVVAYWSKEETKVPVGTRISLQGDSVTAAVRESGRPLLIHDHEAFSGPLIDYARTLGSLPRSTVAAPIYVEGRVWGSIFASAMTVEIADGTEWRVVDFAELAAIAIANAEARRELERLAEEQAALRRVATLVAVGVEPTELFSAVSNELAGLFTADWAAVGRYELDGSGAVLVGASEDLPGIPVGTRSGLDEGIVAGEIYRTGRPARSDDGEAARAVGDARRQFLTLGFISTVGAPIVVEGELWGYVAASSSHSSLPPNTEKRIESFGELVATAIANAEARIELEQLAAEQAALRRVATLVAAGTEPDELFAAVSEEVAQLFAVDGAGVGRFEPDGSQVVVVGNSESLHSIPVGSRQDIGESLISGEVYRTGRAVRRDVKPEDAGDADGLGELAQRVLAMGFFSIVGAPIVVEGEIWGLVTASSSHRTLPPNTEKRVESFCELVAAAIANAESRKALIVSRARIVAAGDEARHRIERNLHDGAQQRLVALGLDVQTVRDKIAPDQKDALSDLERVRHELEAVLEEVRELSHGLHPALLSQVGLERSLRALARKSPVPVELDVNMSERPSEPTETAVYYVISEALTNAAKHADASEISVVVTSSGSDIRVSIGDDGKGGAEASAGSGLVGLIDRIEALGGRFALDSPPGQGTRISLVMPLTAEPMGGIAHAPDGKRSATGDGGAPAEFVQSAEAEMLHEAITASADALYIVDPRGHIRFLNRAALRILGYEDERQLLGRPSHDTIHYLRRDGTPFPAAECPLLLPRLNGEMVRVEEDWFVRQDGSLVAVSYSSAPVALPSGRGAVVSFRESGSA